MGPRQPVGRVPCAWRCAIAMDPNRTEIIWNGVKGLGRLFYLVDPRESTFEKPEEVPDYVAQVKDALPTTCRISSSISESECDLCLRRRFRMSLWGSSWNKRSGGSRGRASSRSKTPSSPWPSRLSWRYQCQWAFILVIWLGGREMLSDLDDWCSSRGVI